MRFDKFLGSNEKVILTVRRHPFVFISTIFALLVMTILPIIILILRSTIVDVFIPREIFDWIAVGLGGYFLFVIVLGLVLWMDYYYDLYVITDAHLIDIDQAGLLSRRVSHISLVRIQDVTTRQKGFWQNLLDFGPVNVQTAGHEEDILLEDVPHCSQVAAKIMQLHDDLIGRERRQDEISEGEGVHPPQS